MYKTLKYFLLFPLFLSLTSCFQIIEEINLKNNGTGDMTLTCNFSKSKTKIASILLLDSINGHKVPNEQEIQKNIEKAIDFLKKTEGITDVKKSVDFKNYIVSIHFSFKDISNINNLTKKILEQQKITATNTSYYSFNKKTKTFSRNYKYVDTAKKQYDKLKTDDKTVFKTAVYTSIYRFENDIVSNSNALAKISKSKKATMLQSPVPDLINGKINISNTIQLSKQP